MNEGINEMYIAARSATLNPSRNVEQITNEIVFIKQHAQKVMLATYIEIGKRLTEAKGMLKHGEWLPWLNEKVQFSRQSAERFMLAYREYGEIYEGQNPNCSILRNISISNALALLAVPEEERETFAAEVDAEHLSTRELEEAIKARAEAEQKIRELESDLKIEKDSNNRAAEVIEELKAGREQAKEKLVDAAKRIKELENRPVEIAVQEPKQEDIDKAVAAAMEEAQKQAEQALAAAKAESEALERKLEKTKKKLEEAKAEAEEDKEADAEAQAEREKLNAEVAELRKKIAMSGEELTTFKLRFSAWQEAWSAMQKALDKVPEEQKDKCCAAIRAVVRGWDL